MADASPESIQKLIENSEKGLAQIEMSLPIVLEARKVIEEAIQKQEKHRVELDLLLTVFDTLLAENEMIYDLSASLDALLKARNDYTKRYYMQSLNLCIVEACQLFVGDDGDEDGLLSRLVRLTKELHQAGCEYIVQHIIDDVLKFRGEYADKELRNITRHYDGPIKMYEKQQGLTSVDLFAKGASELMAIRMEVTVVTSFLLSLFVSQKGQPKIAVSTSKCGQDLKGMLNDAIFKALKEKNLKDEVQETLNKAQASLDECYGQYCACCKAVDFLKEKGCQEPEDFDKLKTLIMLRMETLFLRNDIACSVWDYLNASSDKERSQNLRLIHITKQAALTHIYGYNEKTREKSLWTAIKRSEESNSEKLDTHSIEKSLDEFTGNLVDDKVNSQMFAHYRYKENFYIPDRIEAFGKMEHHKELMEAMKLLGICKVLDTYTAKLLYCINEGQKKERKRQYDEWIAKIDGLVAKLCNDERTHEALKPMKNLIEKVYGDDELSRNV